LLRQRLQASAVGSTHWIDKRRRGMQLARRRFSFHARLVEALLKVLASVSPPPPDPHIVAKLLENEEAVFCGLLLPILDQRAA
jgi:hypothetical protein